MPSNDTLQRQRNLGGLIGIVVLVLGLGYHFFPNLFHAKPEDAAQRSVPVLPASVAGRARRPANRPPRSSTPGRR